MTTSGTSRSASGVRALVEATPWRSVLYDLVVVLAWVLAVSLLFRTTGWPTWAYSLAAFGGVLGYSLAVGR